MAHNSKNTLFLGALALALAACGGGGGAGAPAAPQSDGWTISGQAGGGGTASTLSLSGSGVVIFLSDGTKINLTPGPDGRFTVFLPGGTTLRMGVVVDGDLRRLVVATGAGETTDVLVLGLEGGTIDLGALELVAGQAIPALNPLRRLDTDGDGIVDFSDPDFSPPPFLTDPDGWSVLDHDRDGWSDWDLDRDGWTDDDANRDGWQDGDLDRDGWHDGDTNRDGWIDEACSLHPEWCEGGGPPPEDLFCSVFRENPGCADEPPHPPPPPCDPEVNHCDPPHPPPPPCDPEVDHCDPPHPPPPPCDPGVEGDCHRLWTEFMVPEHGTWHRGPLELASLAGDLPRLHGVNFAVDEEHLCPQPAHEPGVPYTCLVPTPEFPDGPHLLRSIAHGWGPDDIAMDPLEVWFDNTPPRVELVEPFPNALVPSPFVLVAHAVDNLALARVVFRFDGHEACAIPARQDQEVYECLWEAPPGEHHWSAVAFDRAGNAADTAGRRLFVEGDVCIPELPECDPPHPPPPPCDPALEDCAWLWAEILGPPPESWHRGLMEVHGAAGDLPRLAGVSFLVDGAPVCETPAHPEGPYGCLVHTPEFPDGLHHLAMVARGHLEGDAADDGIPVWFDNTPPVVRLAAPEHGALVGNPFALVAHAADNLRLARVVFLFDGHEACVIPASQEREVYECLWEAPPGEHHWTAVAFDRAGNAADADPRGLLVER